MTTTCCLCGQTVREKDLLSHWSFRCRVALRSNIPSPALVRPEAAECQHKWYFGSLDHKDPPVEICMLCGRYVPTPMWEQIEDILVETGFAA